MTLTRSAQLNSGSFSGLKKVLGVLMVLVFLFALFFVSAEAHHECTGEDCSVCACIEECARLIKGFGNLLPAIVSFIAALSAIVLCPLALTEGLVINTPISMKVRMNN